MSSQISYSLGEVPMLWPDRRVRRCCWFKWVGRENFRLYIPIVTLLIGSVVFESDPLVPEPVRQGAARSSLSMAIPLHVVPIPLSKTIRRDILQCGRYFHWPSLSTIIDRVAS